jgi:hypothetical protein
VSDHATETAPRPWDIRPSPADGSGGWLRIGHRAYALRDIAGVSAECRVEPNIDGHLVMIAGFMLAGVAFVLPVALSLVRVKFLVGGALFVGVGLMAASELMRRRASTLYRLEIRLRDGRRAVFATAEPDELLALKTTLERHLAGPM